jgi:hypothetical protein
VCSQLLSSLMALDNPWVRVGDKGGLSTSWKEWDLSLRGEKLSLGNGHWSHGEAPCWVYAGCSNGETGHLSSGAHDLSGEDEHIHKTGGGKCGHKGVGMGLSHLLHCKSPWGPDGLIWCLLSIQRLYI